jgi:hypothetical protein
MLFGEPNYVQHRVELPLWRAGRSGKAYRVGIPTNLGLLGLRLL